MHIQVIPGYHVIAATLLCIVDGIDHLLSRPPPRGNGLNVIAAVLPAAMHDGWAMAPIHPKVLTSAADVMQSW